MFRRGKDALQKGTVGFYISRKKKSRNLEGGTTGKLRGMHKGGKPTYEKRKSLKRKVVHTREVRSNEGIKNGAF